MSFMLHLSSLRDDDRMELSQIAAELCMIKPDRADDMITYLQTTWGHIRSNLCVCYRCYRCVGARVLIVHVYVHCRCHRVGVSVERLHCCQ